jgi:GDP-L-fucose synthase
MPRSIPKTARIFVAGHAGMVGSALCRRLAEQGCTNVLVATRQELDLRDPTAVDAWFREHRPEYVYLVAGTVGGILSNVRRPAEFIYDNLMIHATVVHSAYQHGVVKLLYLGSACIYPRDSLQPITEEQLLAGPLEPTNEPYAIAKIAGIEMCRSYSSQYGCNFISAMPTNLYGPNDNFDLEHAHVLPALMRKLHEAKAEKRREVVIWGTGAPTREFMHVDDLASACLFLMERYDEPAHINVGTGEQISIREAAELMRRIVYPEVELIFDATKPDGMPRRLLDVSRLHALGWTHHTGFEEGLTRTYQWFQDSYERIASGAGGSAQDPQRSESGAR